MAVTGSPRLGLTRWGAGTDPLTRVQLDGDHAALDELVTVWLPPGLAAARPAFGFAGRLYRATDTGELSLDTGAAWVPVAETVPTQGTFAARPAANGRQGIYRVTDAVTVPVGTTYADVAGTWREVAMSEALTAYVAKADPATASVNTGESTTSTSYTDLTSAGPAVTVTTGTRALVIVSLRLWAGTVNSQAFAAFAVSGATTRAADDKEAVEQMSSTSGAHISASRMTLVTGLVAGSNTFTMKYRAAGGGAVAFDYRNIIVIPL